MNCQIFLAGGLRGEAGRNSLFFKVGVGCGSGGILLICLNKFGNCQTFFFRIMWEGGRGGGRNCVARGSCLLKKLFNGIFWFLFLNFGCLHF